MATTGCNANIPCILAWQANNIRGQWKRALCSATLVGFGGIGGIIGSTGKDDVPHPQYPSPDISPAFTLSPHCESPVTFGMLTTLQSSASRTPPGTGQGF
jgi:hypothetical protein